MQAHLHRRRYRQSLGCGCGTPYWRRGEWITVLVVVVQSLSHVRLCSPMNCSTSGLHVPHYLLEFAQIHLDWVGDAIFCRHFFLLPSIFPSIRIFSNVLALLSGCKSIGASASASVLPMTIQDWFLLRLIGLISLLSKELSRVFSSTVVRKHQFFGALPSLWSYSHIPKWLLERPKIWLCGPLSAKWCLCFLIHCLGLS